MNCFYSAAAVRYTSNEFGRHLQETYLYDVLCFGNESSLITCQNNNPGSNCSSNHGAVRCAGEIVQGMTDVQQGLIDLEKCLH